MSKDRKQKRKDYGGKYLLATCGWITISCWKIYLQNVGRREGAESKRRCICTKDVNHADKGTNIGKAKETTSKATSI